MAQRGNPPDPFLAAAINVGAEPTYRLSPDRKGRYGVGMRCGAPCVYISPRPPKCIVGQDGDLRGVTRHNITSKHFWISKPAGSQHAVHPNTRDLQEENGITAKMTTLKIEESDIPQLDGKTAIITGMIQACVRLKPRMALTLPPQEVHLVLAWPLQKSWLLGEHK